jgi:hypothetical protein
LKLVRLERRLGLAQGLHERAALGEREHRPPGGANQGTHGVGPSKLSGSRLPGLSRSR